MDFINLMTYDLHGAWDAQIGMNAPLFEGKADVTPTQKQVNVNASVIYWLQQGQLKCHPRKSLRLTNSN